jgi:hypothetical protein
MGRVVILEGPDGGGKTTLAKKLVERGFDYKHEGPPTKKNVIDYYKIKINDALNTKGDTVFDRLWLGERVYGPICRDEDKVGVMGHRLFDRLLASKPILMYYCCPSLETARKNYQIKLNEPSDYLKSTVKWNIVYERYLEVIGFDSFIRHYNYEEDGDQLDQLLKPFDCMRNLPKGTIGSTTAKYLFVADKPNSMFADFPFFETNNSSGYFNEALEWAGVKESDLAISNAYDHTGKPHSLREMAQSLPKLEKLIIMSSSARSWYFKETKDSINSLKVNFTDHPSYLKRFKGHNPSIMGRLIKEIING